MRFVLSILRMFFTPEISPLRLTVSVEREDATARDLQSREGDLLQKSPLAVVEE